MENNSNIRMLNKDLIVEAEKVKIEMKKGSLIKLLNRTSEGLWKAIANYKQSCTENIIITFFIRHQDFDVVPTKENN